MPKPSGRTRRVFAFKNRNTGGPSDREVVRTYQSTLWKIERFSYDLEMETREKNRNNKRMEIERFDWFIERIQTRVAFS